MVVSQPRDLEQNQDRVCGKGSSSSRGEIRCPKCPVSSSKALADITREPSVHYRSLHIRPIILKS